jgi:hypothetical protein
MSRRLPMIAAGGAAVLVALGAIVAFTGFNVFGALDGDGDGDHGRVDKSQVKITEQQAQTAAMKAVPGTVKQTRLESERGTTAYAVTIDRSDGKVMTVDVNASNAQVIRKENGAEGNDGDDGE